MNEIAWIQDNNPAGLLLLECSPQVLLHGGAGTIPLGPVTLTTESPWLSIYGSVNTKSYEEAEQATEHGPLYGVSTGAFLPGDSAPIRQILRSMAWYRWIVRVTDARGIKRLVGTPTEALQLTASFGISPDMGGQRGYQVRLTGDFTQRPEIVG